MDIPTQINGQCQVDADSPGNSSCFFHKSVPFFIPYNRHYIISAGKPPLPIPTTPQGLEKDAVIGRVGKMQGLIR
jgi:hypothetical protein